VITIIAILYATHNNSLFLFYYDFCNVMETVLYSSFFMIESHIISLISSINNNYKTFSLIFLLLVTFDYFRQVKILKDDNRTTP
jgi:hypothetical protein